MLNPNNHNRTADFDRYHLLYNRRELSAFLENHGLHMSRALGQNFFLRRDILVDLILQANLPQGQTVIEIGPGIGHLTWVLIEHGLNVIAVEKDQTFSHHLSDLAHEIPDRLQVINQDFLETDLPSLAHHDNAHHIIGNLPYNAAVPILFHAAYSSNAFESLNVMVQREVGERILAPPETKAYGRLSIVLNYLYRIEPIRILPPECFFPEPKVESMFIKLTPKPNIDKEFAKKFLERVVQVGFMHRRKKLRNQFLGAIIGRRYLNKNFMNEAESRFNFDQRAEEWPLDTWLRFARYIENTAPEKKP